MTLGLDPGYDASYLAGSSKVKIYSFLADDSSNEGFGIQALPEQNQIIVPLGIETTGIQEVEFKLSSGAAIEKYGIDPDKSDPVKL